MSSCIAFKTLWSEWQEGSLSETDSGAMVSHLETCESCQIYDWQMKDMLNNLGELRKRSLISEEDKNSLFFKVFARARMEQNRKPRRMRQYAIAASLCVAVITAALLRGNFVDWSQGEEYAVVTSRPEVVMTLAQVQNVKLAFDSKKDIDDVTFTIRLPDGVEVSGFPQQQTLSWIGTLRKGLNGLTLPLVAQSFQQDDIVVAQIEYGDIRQQMELVLKQENRIN